MFRSGNPCGFGGCTAPPQGPAVRREPRLMHPAQDPRPEEADCPLARLALQPEPPPPLPGQPGVAPPAAPGRKGVSRTVAGTLTSIIMFLVFARFMGCFGEMQQAGAEARARASASRETSIRPTKPGAPPAKPGAARRPNSSPARTAVPLPAQRDALENFKRLYRLAEAAGLEMPDAKVLPHVYGPRYSEQPIRCVCKGNFADVVQFLRGAEESFPHLNVDSFDLAP